MEFLLSGLSSSDILLAIIIVAILIVIVVVWIVITNFRKQDIVIPKKKVETIEEILQEPVKPPVEDKNVIQELLDQMAKDLEAKEKDEVASFEQEQEEKAIISYQQLIAAKKGENAAKTTSASQATPVAKSPPEPKPTLTPKPTQNIEIIDIPEEPTEKITIDEPVVEDKTVKEESSLDDTKKFRSTGFISPVYGRSDMNVQYRNVDRSEIMAKLTAKEVKSETPRQPITPRPVEIPKQPVQQVKEPASIPNTRLGRLEANKSPMEEKPILKETGSAIKEAPKSDETKKNEEFLKALIAFRKNLE